MWAPELCDVSKVYNRYIYGRGALDLKSNVIAILHAVDQLCTEGFQPQRSLYVAFGHDEELGGAAGAVKIVELLESQKVISDALAELRLFLRTACIELFP